jgi:hypothetical protein
MSKDIDQKRSLNLEWLIVLFCYLPIILYLFAWGVTILIVSIGIASPSWAMPMNLLFYLSAISAYIVIPATILFLIYIIARRKIILLLVTLPSFLVNIFPVYIVMFENDGYMITA